MIEFDYRYRHIGLYALRHAVAGTRKAAMPAGHEGVCLRRARQATSGMITVLWRGIPAQVSATDWHETVKVVLPKRFQVAIDRAATVAAKSDMDSYVQEWRRDLQPLVGDPQIAAHSPADPIDRDFTRELLSSVVTAGGLVIPNTTGAAATDLPDTSPGADRRGST